MRRAKKKKRLSAGEVMALVKAARGQYWDRKPSLEQKHNHTRATFGHKYTGRMVPVDLDCPPEHVPYNPGWEPPLRTFEPNFVEKNSIRYWVIYRYEDGTEKLVRDDFKICCAQGRTCKRNGCASCWVAFNLFIPKGINVIIRPVPSNQKTTIVDPAGVDNHGFRPQGKSLGFQESENYKLTSTQKRYKGESGKQ